MLANLFLHYGFDLWMARTHPTVKFERYVDDAVVHCASRQQAESLQAAIGQRMVEIGLRLHPDKTRIIYCKDSNRRGAHDNISFTFLGYTFRPREALNKRRGVKFTSFQPAMSQEKLVEKIRKSVVGGYTDDRMTLWLTSHGQPTRSCEDGCPTGAGFTGPRWMHSSNASTPT